MSKTRSLHHIVFATKKRENTIPEEYKKELYAYIFGVVKNKKCWLVRMNGVGNHIHMLVDLHPGISLSNFVKDVKQWSSHWLKHNPQFPDFDGWCDGYYAVSVGVDGLHACKEYIIRQEIHHKSQNLLSEMGYMAEANGLAWHDKDWQ